MEQAQFDAEEDDVGLGCINENSDEGEDEEVAYEPLN